jgi:uncharacterized membrane protein
MRFPVGLSTMAVALVIVAPSVSSSTASPVSDPEVLAIAIRHCAMCHAARPTHESFKEAPKGVTTESIEDLRRYAGKIYAQTVQSRAMPLGNQTGMTEEERATLGQWVRAQK